MKRYLYYAAGAGGVLVLIWLIGKALGSRTSAPADVATPDIGAAGLTFVPGLGFVPTAQAVQGNVTEGDGFTVVGTFG